MSLAGMFAITTFIAFICWIVSWEYRHYNRHYDEEAAIANKIIGCGGKVEWTVRLPEEAPRFLKADRCVSIYSVKIDTRSCLEANSLLREVVTLQSMTSLIWEGDGAPNSLAQGVKAPASLRLLILNYAPYTWEEIAAFLEKAHDLRYLHLSHIPDIEFSGLRDLDCPQLESLHVSFTRFGLENGLREACAIPSLRELGAYYTHLDDRCVPYLIESPIRDIRIGTSTKVTQDGIAKLRAAGKRVFD